MSKEKEKYIYLKEYSISLHSSREKRKRYFGKKARGHRKWPASARKTAKNATKERVDRDPKVDGPPC